MKKEAFDEAVYIRMTKGQLKRIDSYAAKIRITRSQMIRNLIDSGLDSANFMNSFGVFDLVGFFRDNKIKPMDVLSLAEK